MNNKLQIAKAVTTFVVGAGTSKIVSGIIQNNTDPKNVYDQVSIGAASFVIGSMAANATRQYTDRLIDDLAVTVTKLRKKNTTA